MWGHFGLVCSATTACTWFPSSLPFSSQPCIWAFQVSSLPLLSRLCHWEDSASNVLPLSFCRIHLEDLSQSVLLHMTEKLGYKNSDVINTVLSNRASHTLAIYFLLNKKLERYLASLRVSSAWCWFFGQAGERVKKCLKIPCSLAFDLQVLPGFLFLHTKSIISNDNSPSCWGNCL